MHAVVRADCLRPAFRVYHGGRNTATGVPALRNGNADGNAPRRACDAAGQAFAVGALERSARLGARRPDCRLAGVSSILPGTRQQAAMAVMAHRL